MTTSRQTWMGLCMAVAAWTASAQTADEHKNHHPQAAAPSAAPIQKPADSAMRAAKMGAMDQHMKAMLAMHEKLAAAKTPEERQALMSEHMKLMQEGMAMMKPMEGTPGMGGMPSDKAPNSGMADRQRMLEKRMDMMESMMQMMMDCMPPSGPAN